MTSSNHEDDSSEATCFAVIYTENHPDRDRTFLGVFSSKEKAEGAIHRHMTAERKRLPRAKINVWDYDIFEGEIDSAYWEWGWWG